MAGSWPARSTKDALLRQLRGYLHQVCHSLGLSTRIVPHQLRHTYATEMLRAGVSFPALMKLLGHTSPDMTMLYIEVALNDLQRRIPTGSFKTSASGSPAENVIRRHSNWSGRALSIPCSPLNMHWKCSGGRCRLVPPALASIGSPIASPK